MADIIIIAVLAAAAFIIIRSRIRKLGKGSCCGSCAGCSGCGLQKQENGDIP